MSFIIDEYVTYDPDLIERWVQRLAAHAQEVKARRLIDDRTTVTSRGLRYTTDLHADPNWRGPRRVLP